MSITITVTEEHVAKARELIGGPDHPRVEYCPIALAVRDATGEPWAFVNQDDIGWGRNMPACKVWAETPEAAVNFIDAFDDNQDVRPLLPFTFEL